MVLTCLMEDVLLIKMVGCHFAGKLIAVKTQEWSFFVEERLNFGIDTNDMGVA